MRTPLVFIRAVDGIILHGRMARPAHRPTTAKALLVHGLAGDMDETELYSGIAGDLAAAGCASLRFDMRGHGGSGGRMNDVTMSSTINDIDAAYGHLAAADPPTSPIFVVVASFAGGLSAWWAADYCPRPAIRGMVMLCPVLDYQARMLDRRSGWHAAPAGLDCAEARALDKHGSLTHGEFGIGRALLHDLALHRPHDVGARLRTPLIVLHGDMDSVAPCGVARQWSSTVENSTFVSIAGADHMFVDRDDDDDDDVSHLRTIFLRSMVREKVCRWIAAVSRPAAGRQDG